VKAYDGALSAYFQPVRFGNLKNELRSDAYAVRFDQNEFSRHILLRLTGFQNAMQQPRIQQDGARSQERLKCVRTSNLEIRR
jgi:hypothetical protein